MPFLFAVQCLEKVCAQTVNFRRIFVLLRAGLAEAVVQSLNVEFLFGISWLIHNVLILKTFLMLFLELNSTPELHVSTSIYFLGHRAEMIEHLFLACHFIL